MIGRKIYYDKATGQVIASTGEGDMMETTKEQDFAGFSALAERVPETVDFIQLEYEQFKEDFRRCSGLKVDLETKELRFTYADDSDPGTPAEPQKPLTLQVDELKQQLATLQAAMDDLILGGAI